MAGLEAHQLQCREVMFQRTCTLSAVCCAVSPTVSTIWYPGRSAYDARAAMSAGKVAENSTVCRPALNGSAASSASIAGLRGTARSG